MEQKKNHICLLNPGTRAESRIQQPPVQDPWRLDEAGGLQLIGVCYPRISVLSGGVVALSSGQADLAPGAAVWPQAGDLTF